MRVLCGVGPVALPLAVVFALAAPAPTFATPFAVDTLTIDTLLTRPGQYVGVALSVVPTDSMVASVFSGLGSYDVSNWRLFRWLPGLGNVETGASWNTVERGQGYWLITRDGGTALATGTSATVDTLGVPLERGTGRWSGWNQLGNPFPFPISASQLRVGKRDSLRQVAPPFADPGVWVWFPADTAFGAVTTIPPRTAFWIHTTDQDPDPAWTTWVANDTQYRGNLSSLGWDFAVDANGKTSLLCAQGYDVGLRLRHGYGWDWNLVYRGLDREVYGGPGAVAIDSAGTAHIVYIIYGPGNDFYYRQVGAAGWAGWLGDADLLDGLRMVLDRRGQAHLFERWSGSPATLAHETPGLGMRRDTIATVTGLLDPDIAADPSGFAHVSYIYGTADGPALAYVWLKSGGWYRDVLFYPPLDPPYYNVVSQALALTPQGLPCVAYARTDRDPYRLLLEQRTGTGASATWQESEVTGNPTYGRVFLAIDGQGRRHLLLCDEVGHRVYYRRQQGTNWSLEEIPVHGLRNVQRFLVDTNGDPSFAYRDTVTGDVRIAERRPGDLVLQIPPSAVSAPDPGPQSPAIPDAAWLLTLTVRRDSRTSPPAFLGCAAARPAPAGESRIGRPPAPCDVPGRLEVAVAGDEDESERFVVDLRPEGAPPRWPIVVTGTGTPGEVALHLETRDLPEASRVWLEDPLAGWRCPWPAGRDIALMDTRSPRRLQVTVEPDSATAARAPAGGGPRAVYPNPFARTVGLVFDLEAKARVAADVFDVQGRRVRSLTIEFDGAGEHVLTWDGRDARGHDAGAGVFLVRCRVDGRESLRRVVKL